MAGSSIAHYEPVDSEVVDSSNVSFTSAAKPSLEVYENTITDKQAKRSKACFSSVAWTYALEDTWLLDIAALICSAASLFAVALLLGHYDGKTRPDWQHVSLNTIVALLSTVGKACALLPISRGIGQLKWIWFAEKERTLLELRTFDDASRGVIGSAQLLWKQRARHFAALACFATILAIFFDPFVQNLIHSSVQTVADPSQTAYLTNSSFYSATGYASYYVGEDDAGQDTNQPVVDPILKSNVYSALLDTNSRQQWSIPEYTCPSGACSWAAVPTLVAAYQCADISTHITKSCTVTDTQGEVNCTVSVPSGVSLSYISNYTDQELMSVSEASVLSLNASSAIVLASVQYLAAIESLTTEPAQFKNLTETSGFTATECIVQLCVQHVAANVFDNDYQPVTIMEDWHAATADSVQQEASGDGPWCQLVSSAGPEPGLPQDLPTDLKINDEWYWFLQTPAVSSSEDGANGTSSQTYAMSKKAYRGLLQFLTQLFSGTAQVKNSHLAFEATEFGPYYPQYATADVMQAIFSGSMSGCTSPDKRLECAMNNTAKALTKSFRDSNYLSQGPEAAKTHTGDVIVQRTFIHIEWAWLTVPILIWCLGVVVWLGTARKTSRAKVMLWRHNLLPLLFMNNEFDDEKVGSDTATRSQTYVKRAGQIMTRLRVTREKAEFR